MKDRLSDSTAERPEHTDKWVRKEQDMGGKETEDTS